MVPLFALGFLLFTGTGALGAGKDYMTLQEKLGKDLMQGYNKNIKPNHQVNVTVNMFIRDFSKISTKEGSAEFQITFRQKWQDSRLKYEGKGYNNIQYYTLLAGQEKSIWMPDTFFRNELESHQHTTLEPNQYIRIYPDGSVLHSSRITLKTTCPMDLTMFPFDKPECQMMIASYGWQEDDVKYSWKETEPLQIVKDLRLPEFSLMVMDMKTERCDVKTSTGTYSCLDMKFTVSRESSFYVTMYFIPAFMFFIISWAAFFISAREITPRLLLQFGSLLCIALLSFMINYQTRVVAYTKASDIYFGITITFVFFSLIDTVLFGLFANQLEKEAEADSCMERLKNGSWITKFDLISRIIYPVLYIIFFIIYFAVYGSM